MPTDAEVEDEISLRYQTVDLEVVRAMLDRTSGVKIVILDACHNNPLIYRCRRSAFDAALPRSTRSPGSRAWCSLCNSAG
jgi:hypothetical protein